MPLKTLEDARDLVKKAKYARTFLAGRLVHVNLQITYTCNFRCQICDFWREDTVRKRDLTARDAQVIARKLAQIGPQIVSIGGGEPLLNREVVPIVRALATDHFPVMICNGWYVTPARARELWEAGMHEISVSVDYADPARHDAQRGREGAFSRAMEALSHLHRARTRPHQRVNMISVIMDDNLADVEPLIRRCEELGITYLITLYSDRRGSKTARVAPGGVSDHLLQLKQRHKHFVALRGYIARFSQGIREGGIGGCTAGKLLCNIDSDGNVSLCIDRVDEPLGNIFELGMDPIEARLRAAHHDNTCRDCWTSCRGSIESIVHGSAPVKNLLDYYQMTRSVGLGARFG